MASCHARSNWRFPSAGHLPLASSQKAGFCFGRASNDFCICSTSHLWQPCSGLALGPGFGHRTGTKVGAEILVNTTTEGGRNLPTITSLEDGGFVIAWVDGSGLGGDSSVSSIKAQVFDAAGGKVGGEFLVNTRTEAQQNFPTITDLSNGGFVVTWSDRSGLDGDSDPRSIKAQVFDATGTKVGGEFLVNTRTTGSQNIPVIAGLSNDGFVIAWNDFRSDLGSSTRAQVFDATGTEVGSEFLVADVGGSVDIAGLDGGGFVIVWGGLNAQVFDATGTKVGSQFLVNDTTAGNTPAITDPIGGRFVIAWEDSSNVIRAQIFGTSDNAPVITTAGTQTVAENTKVIAELTSTDVDTVGTNPAISRSRAGRMRLYSRWLRRQTAASCYSF